MVLQSKTYFKAKFALGYQLADPDECESFVDVVRDYRYSQAEVYFSWLDMASGRSSPATQQGCTDWTAQQRMEEELQATREMGIKLDLLFNANCYGGRAVSKHLENQVGSLLEHLESRVGGVDIVTTTSPFIARCVKTYFSKIETRATVNMRIDTSQAMAMMTDLFDSFYIQRDVQRNLKHLERLRSWSEQSKVKLGMLVNSGCLRNCPSQVFHDNLVAHESDLAETDNVTWNPILCRRKMQHRDFRSNLLKATWVRPEDLQHYASYAHVFKLATRMHASPRHVLDAYCSGHFKGNLADLVEPSFSQEFAPSILDNQHFPEDWFQQTSTCAGHCESCEYCDKALSQVIGEQSPQSDASVNDDLVPVAGMLSKYVEIHSSLSLPVLNDRGMF